MSNLFRLLAAGVLFGTCVAGCERKATSNAQFVGSWTIDADEMARLGKRKADLPEITLLVKEDGLLNAVVNGESNYSGRWLVSDTTLVLQMAHEGRVRASAATLAGGKLKMVDVGDPSSVTIFTRSTGPAVVKKL